MVRGESIYKASERIKTYGVEAFVKMLGKTAIKKRGGKAKLLKYYAEKYPGAPLSLKPKAPYISRAQRSYWKDVKSLVEARKISTKQSRKLLKSLKTARNVRVRVIKRGEGWQLVMTGLYERRVKDGKELEAPFERSEQTGHSHAHEEQDYEEAFEECQKDALNSLGGSMAGDGYANIDDSDWTLVKVLKETWNRFYGREQ